MSQQTTGTVLVVQDPIQVSDKFMKRTIVLSVKDGAYEQKPSFEFTQDKCSLLDHIEEGQTVTIHWNLNGRDWTSPQGETKYFNTLNGWKIESGDF